MNSATYTAIFQRLSAHIQNPTTELKYGNQYQLLVAVMLSAQATDVSVNKATQALFKIVKTPKHMLALGEAELKTYIKTIGLYNTKAKNLIRTSELLVQQHRGRVPKTREALEALPGVGRKTANVVLNTAFGLPTIAVDTHIFRLSNRLGLAPGKTVFEVETLLERRVPETYRKDAHHWLILHGRYTCIARKPRCGSCVIEDLCEYPDKHYGEPTMPTTKKSRQHVV